MILRLLRFQFECCAPALKTHVYNRAFEKFQRARAQCAAAWEEWGEREDGWRAAAVELYQASVRFAEERMSHNLWWKERSLGIRDITGKVAWVAVPAEGPCEGEKNERGGDAKCASVCI